jgi:hypothetical protein
MTTWMDALQQLLSQVLTDHGLDDWRLHLGRTPSGERTPLLAITEIALRVTKRSNTARYGTLNASITGTGLDRQQAEQTAWEVLLDAADHAFSADPGIAVDGRLEEFAVARDEGARGEDWWKTEAMLSYAVKWPR